MRKRQLAMAAGPMVAALVSGGLLYMFYPNSSNPLSNTSDATSAYSPSENDQQLNIGIEQNILTDQDNTANTTTNTKGNASRQIPSPEPRQPSENSGY
jgi:hypothetical protein